MADIAAFQTAFHGDLITPSDNEYGKAIARWAVNTQRNAAIVAFVKDTDDIALAIKYAKDNKLPIAVRCGGHSFSGASSSEGGLIVDLSRHLNTVRIDAEKKLAYVGGGSIWETVDKAAIEHGLATVGGTTNHTGVGGLTLGGGYGWLSGEHGLAIDNLVEATVVVANGSVLKANKTENSDLFWGIRGAGSNFGVVSEFVFQLHPQRRTVFAGKVIYASHQAEQLANLTEAWWMKGPNKKEAMGHALTVDPTGKPLIVAILFYNGSEDEGRANFKAFFDIGPVKDMTRETPYEELNTIINDMNAHGRNRYNTGGYSTKPRAVIYKEALERISQLSAKCPTKANITLLFEHVPLQTVNSIAGDATAFSRLQTGNTLALTAWDETSEENERYLAAAAKELARIGATQDSQLGENQHGTYGNYSADSVINEEKARLLFGENYSRLQLIKKKYDPDVLFFKWFVVTPAA